MSSFLMVLRFLCTVTSPHFWAISATNSSCASQLLFNTINNTATSTIDEKAMQEIATHRGLADRKHGILGDHVHGRVAPHDGLDARLRQ